MDTKKTCVFKEIGLHAQNMITILGSIVNMIGGDLSESLTSTKFLTLKMHKIFN